MWRIPRLPTRCIKYSSALEREVSFLGGEVLCTPAAIERVRIRARIKDGERSPHAYNDRQGITHLPYEEALVIAKNFCAAEPSAVLPGVEATERQWARKARTPGRDTSVSLLNEFQAAAALIRQWTGHDPEIAQREEEIRMLERLALVTTKVSQVTRSSLRITFASIFRSSRCLIPFTYASTCLETRS